MACSDDAAASPFDASCECVEGSLARDRIAASVRVHSHLTSPERMKQAAIRSRHSSNKSSANANTMGDDLL